jgi:membrane fusion protein, heavy metal efflux system
MIPRTLSIIIVSAMGYLCSSCSSKNEAKESSHEKLPDNAVEINSEQYKLAGIQLGKITGQRIKGILKVNGMITVPPRDIATVSAPLGGFIKSTNLVQGSTVKKGETVALIENLEFIELQKSYLEAKARFTFIEVDYNRHKELYKENIYSEKNLQQIETEYKTTKAQLKALEQKLLLIGVDIQKLSEDNISGVLPVVSPIGGYIRTVNVNVGKYVSPTDVLFEVINPENIILELGVYEKDIDKVMNGQTISFTSPNDPERPYTARIYQAGKALDDNKIAKIYASIDKPGEKLISGMFVNADVNINSDSVTVVPQEAVVQFNDRFYIFAFKGKRIENRKEINDFIAIEVRKGTNDAGFTQVILPANIRSEELQVAIKGAYIILSAWKNSGEMAC